MTTKLNYMVEYLREVADDLGDSDIRYIADMMMEISIAFKDVTKGSDDIDIQRLTGLPIERCKEIYRIYKLLDEVT